MEGSYGCNVNNRFELFLDEENDPLDLLAKQEEEKRRAQDKPASKKDKKDVKKKGLSKSLAESIKTIAAVTLDAPPASAPTTAAKPLARRNDGPPKDNTRPPRRNENMEKRNNEKNFESKGDFEHRPQRDGERKPFRGGGGRGGGGAPRGGGNRREFERHSGTDKSGVKSVEKRGGQGQYNWGNEQTQWNQEEPEQPLNETNPEKDPEVADDNAEAVPAEPEVTEKTLDQWKQEMAARKSKAEYNTNIRKPNEGEKEDPKLKKAVVLKKKKEESEDEHCHDDDESEDEDQKIKKQLESALAAQFHFVDQRGGGAPRGRGRGRGGGPPGGGLGGRPERPPPQGPRRQERQQQQHTPRVEDLNDFPSLAAA